MAKKKARRTSVEFPHDDVNAKMLKIRQHDLFPVVEKIMHMIESSTATLEVSGSMPEISLEVQAVMKARAQSRVNVADPEMDSYMCEVVQSLAVQLQKVGNPSVPVNKLYSDNEIFQELKQMIGMSESFVNRYNHAVRRRVVQASLAGPPEDDFDDDFSPADEEDDGDENIRDTQENALNIAIRTHLMKQSESSSSQ